MALTDHDPGITLNVYALPFRLLTLLVAILVLPACSIVLDPGELQGGNGDTGTPDAGPDVPDAPEMDAVPDATDAGLECPEPDMPELPSWLACDDDGCHTCDGGSLFIRDDVFVSSAQILEGISVTFDSRGRTHLGYIRDAGRGVPQAMVWIDGNRTVRDLIGGAPGIMGLINPFAIALRAQHPDTVGFVVLGEPLTTTFCGIAIGAYHEDVGDDGEFNGLHLGCPEPPGFFGGVAVGGGTVDRKARAYYREREGGEVELFSIEVEDRDGSTRHPHVGDALIRTPTHVPIDATRGELVIMPATALARDELRVLIWNGRGGTPHVIDTPGRSTDPAMAYLGDDLYLAVWGDAEFLQKQLLRCTSECSDTGCTSTDCCEVHGGNIDFEDVFDHLALAPLPGRGALLALAAGSDVELYVLDWDLDLIVPDGATTSVGGTVQELELDTRDNGDGEVQVTLGIRGEDPAAELASRQYVHLADMVLAACR
jgi:hypothetical protein